MFEPIDDTTAPIITAESQISSIHPTWHHNLPDTAVIFFFKDGVECFQSMHGGIKLLEPFPCMLDDKYIYHSTDSTFVFLYGGAGAPQAADTIETLHALGVDTIISVGLVGTFSTLVNPGDLILPNRAFVEEGTSRHYYNNIEISSPDNNLHNLALDTISAKSCPIVSTDAVYRQTFHKEDTWRSVGAVGVDMETSAVFNVSRYLGVKSVALLIASDVHPQDATSSWQWMLSDMMKRNLVAESKKLVQAILNTGR